MSPFPPFLTHRLLQTYPPEQSYCKLKWSSCFKSLMASADSALLLGSFIWKGPCVLPQPRLPTRRPSFLHHSTLQICGCFGFSPSVFLTQPFTSAMLLVPRPFLGSPGLPPESRDSVIHEPLRCAFPNPQAWRSRFCYVLIKVRQYLCCFSKSALSDYPHPNTHTRTHAPRET